MWLAAKSNQPPHEKTSRVYVGVCDDAVWCVLADMVESEGARAQHKQKCEVQMRIEALAIGVLGNKQWKPFSHFRNHTNGY